MKLLIIPNSVQLLGRGLLASALLTTGLLYAAEPSPETPAADPNTQGSGASRLSGNSETAPAGSKSWEAGSTSTKTTDAKSFLREAMEGNSAEIALAEVAERNAQNPQVKQLAQMIRTDHQQANEQLQPIAQAHGVALNQPLESQHQKKLERFQKLSGSELDQAYTKDMLKDHVKDISKYEQAAQQLKETDVQQYAQNTLPTLRKHLQESEQAALAAGVDQSTISSITKKSSGAMGGTTDQQERESGGTTQP